MTIRVAINGYGRIGRNILRAHYEQRKHDIAIVAINDLASAEASVHLTRYDTVHGRFPVRVDLDGNVMAVGGDYIKVFAQPDPSRIPWSDFGIDVVMECTGRFTTKAKASAHLKGGARKVVISALGDEAVDATVVYGVNHRTLKPWHTVISNASCTTNCLAPVAQPLDRSIGIVSGIVTSVQGYTSDQTLTDVHDDDLRRARSATMSMIPVKTGAPAAIGRILPELAGKLDGVAIRVPTPNVSVVDFKFVARRATSKDEINSAVKRASEQQLKGILGYTEAPNVSSDFNHDSHSSVFAIDQTKVMEGTLVRVMSWYDNEWGFSNRMIDTAVAMGKLI